MAKFKFVNGVMIKEGDVPTKGTDVIPIATVCSPDDIVSAVEVNPNMAVPMTTQVAINEVTDDSFLQKFKCREGVNENEILDRLSFLFSEYEVPIGLLSKLLVLTEYNLNVILDDSGSMNARTDSTVAQAGPYMKSVVLSGLRDTEQMTRWQEQEDRVHTMIDFIGCIPTGPFTISFMNRSDRFTVEHNGNTPEEWINDAHTRLRKACSLGPNGGTPTLEKLRDAFNNSRGKTMHYLFTDGVPNGGPEDVSKLILARKNPSENPLTMVSCTNVDSECDWMKQIEEDGPFVSETDDYNDERDEVRHDQGAAFPYSKGMWLICMIVGAINPYDLDSLDDTRPMSKYTFDNIIGRVSSPEEYRKYWDNHPKKDAEGKPVNYDKYYSSMCSEEKHTHQIMGSYTTGAITRLVNKFKSLGH